MPTILFSNNASATLASSISTSATTITVSTGQGALFPAISGGNLFYATLTDSSNNLEIVKVTGRASDVLTVVRAQEGTTARAYAAADKIELRIPAAALNNFAQLSADQTFTGTNTFSTAPTLSTPLAILSGGTGSSTSTGSGAVVLATSPTLVTPALGTPVSGVLTNCSGDAASLRSGAVKTTNFLIEESGGKLVIRYGTTIVASISSTGAIVSANDVSAFGTP